MYTGFDYTKTPWLSNLVENKRVFIKPDVWNMEALITEVSL